MRPGLSANQFDLEVLEPRILLSAEPLPAAGATSLRDSPAIVVTVTAEPEAKGDSAGSAGQSIFEGLDEQPVGASAEAKSTGETVSPSDASLSAFPTGSSTSSQDTPPSAGGATGS